MGPEAVLYAILDDYSPVIPGLQNDIDEIEDQLFAGDEGVSRRIYELSREVINLQRASQPLVGMLEALLRGSDKYQVEIELQRYLRDVLDHALRIGDRAGSRRRMCSAARRVDHRRRERTRSVLWPPRKPLRGVPSPGGRVRRDRAKALYSSASQATGPSSQGRALIRTQLNTSATLRA
jgi:hypothetical protein